MYLGACFWHTSKVVLTGLVDSYYCVSAGPLRVPSPMNLRNVARLPAGRPHARVHSGRFLVLSTDSYHNNVASVCRKSVLDRADPCIWRGINVTAPCSLGEIELPLRKECVDGAGRESHSSGPSRAFANSIRCRLAVWSIVALAGAIAVRLVPLLDPTVHQAILAFCNALCACAALGGGLYYFTSFIVSHRVRDLLESTAFVTIGSGAILQVAVDAAASQSQPDDRLLCVALLCGSAAFCGAAFAKSGWRPSTRAGNWLLLTLSGVFVCAFPLAASPYAYEIALFGTGSAYTAAGLVCPLAAGFLLLAFAGYVMRFRQNSNRRCPADCYLLMPLAMAALSRTFSTQPTDWWAEYSHVAFIGAWVVFVAAISIEQALMARESSERLSELETLQAISWSLVGARTSGELFQRLADVLRERFEAEITMVHLLTESGDALEVVAVSGAEEAADRLHELHRLDGPDFRRGFHTGHTARAFGTNTMQKAIDVEIDVELVPWRVLARGNGCALSVPLAGSEGAFGVVGFYFPNSASLSEQRVKAVQATVVAASPTLAVARSQTAVAVEDLGFDLAA